MPLGLIIICLATVSYSIWRGQHDVQLFEKAQADREERDRQRILRAQRNVDQAMEALRTYHKNQLPTSQSADSGVEKRP